MRTCLLIAPLLMLGLAGCVDVVHEHPAQPAASTTYVTPSSPAYVAPGTSTTVVTRP